MPVPCTVICTSCPAKVVECVLQEPKGTFDNADRAELCLATVGPGREEKANLVPRVALRGEVPSSGAFTSSRTVGGKPDEHLKAYKWELGYTAEGD